MPLTIAESLFQRRFDLDLLFGPDAPEGRLLVPVAIMSQYPAEILAGLSSVIGEFPLEPLVGSERSRNVT
jgi:hypothetical protein